MQVPGYDGLPSMKLIAIMLAVLGACTGEGSQIVIQLDGPMAASSVELVFAQPHVFIKRSQRINEPPIDPASEPAFYVFQRRKLDLVLDGVQPVDGIELQIVGAEDLLPIAIARDAQQQIIGMGVLDPPQVFRDTDDNTENFPTALTDLADITRYRIAIEPVVDSPGFTASGRPVSLGGGEVHELRCDHDGPVSGILWRPEPTLDGEQHQLRIALPLDGSDDGASRVEREGFDLDCDTHTPALRGFVADGDETDCDDTSPLVTGDADPGESCDQIDSDCDANTMGATLVPGGCGTCLGNQLTCYEAAGPDPQFDSAGCTEASRCVACSPRTQSPNGVFAGCESHGAIQLPGECGNDCVIRLVGSDPRWEVKIGDPDDPTFGITEGYTPSSNRLGIAVSPTNNPPLEPASPDFGGFTLAYQPGEGARVFVLEVVLTSSSAPTDSICALPFEVMPPCGIRE